MSEIELSRAGEIKSLADIVRLLRPSVEAPVVLPASTGLLPSDLLLLNRFPEVYAKVVPTERRRLTDKEILDLHAEREVIDALEKLIKARKDDIRTTVVNSMDVEFEESPPAGEDAPGRDKDGHYIRKGLRDVPETRKRFSWEVTGGKVDVDLVKLEELAADEAVTDFTWQDFYDVTREIRQIDAGQFIEKLKEKPEILRHAGDFITQDAPRGSLYIRNQK